MRKTHMLFMLLLVLPAPPAHSANFRVIADNVSHTGANVSCSGAKLPPVWCNGKLFYSGADRRGRELWVYDETTGTTRCVKDIHPGPNDSAPQSMIALGDRIYFTARHDAQSRDRTLWVSDGTEEGTNLVPRVGNRPHALNILQDRLHFLADVPATTKDGLWTSTSEGWRGFRWIVLNDNDFEPTVLNSGDALWLCTYRGLWRTDGTTEGTRFVAPVDIRNTTHATALKNIDYSHAVLNGAIIFPGQMFNDENKVGVELWRSDGTADGTFCIKDLAWYKSSNPAHIIRCDDFVFFTAYVDDAQTDYGREPCRTDGTPEGTYLLKDLAPGSVSSDVEYPIVYGHKVHFWAENDRGVTCQWKTDGTSAGTEMVSDWGRPRSFTPSPFVVYRDALYFTAFTGGRSLICRTDGTQAGSQVVAECPRRTNHLPVVLNERLFLLNDKEIVEYQP